MGIIGGKLSFQAITDLSAASSENLVPGEATGVMG